MPPARNRPAAEVQLKNGFTSGAILKIKLVNFMTYDKFQFEPGPRMNVIVGPNGTGKSTLLCAICLGLGGKPSNVGRASAVGDYVKHGCRSGSVEIELCNIHGANHIVFREIHRDNHSTWMLNNSPTTSKLVEELMVRLNIQLKNLCQFLPQDRVAEFVKMTPQQLLESTEKAAGDPGMWEDHLQLMNCQNKSQDLQLTVTQLQEDLQAEMQQKTRLEERVKTFKAREGHLVSIEMLEKKKCWMEYNDARDRFTFAKTTKDKKEKELTASRQKLQPLQNAFDKIKRNVLGFEQKTKQLASDFRLHHKKAVDKLQSIVKLSERSAEIVEEYKEKVALEEKRHTHVSTMTQQLQAMQRELENLPHNDLETPQLETVNREIKDNTNMLNKIVEKISGHTRVKRTAQQDHQAAQTELNKLQDVKRVRMEILRQKHRDAYAATMWLRENREKFQKTIHEPIFTVVNMKNPQFAKYFEMHIPFKDLVAFVCEDENDMETFVSCVRDQQNLRVNVAMAPTTHSDTFKAARPLHSIEKWGFHSYLKDLIEVPEAILAYLCTMYRIHDIPIGNADTKRNIERVMDEVPFVTFFTENHQYRTRISKYGNQGRSTICNELKPANLLIANVDMARIRELKMELERCSAEIDAMSAAIQDLQAQEREINVTLEALRIKKKELTQQRDLKKNLMGKIETKRKSIRESENDKLDLEKEKRDANSKILQVVIIRSRGLEEHQQIAKDWFEIGKARTLMVCKHACADTKKDEIAKELHKCSSYLPALEQEVANCKENVYKLQVRAKGLLEAAKKKSGVKGQELPANLDEEFSSLPDTMEEVDNEIRHLQAQVDCLHHPDYDNSLEEYQRWQRKTEKIEQNYRLKAAELATFRTDIEKVHERWLLPLRNLLQQVNVRFSEYFKSLGCSGEVDIKVGDSERDYAKYGICIRVTYRAGEPLRELTQFYQSGGERSVATILYLLALQEFIKLPFCCVDEINQGMDSTNERRIFQLMTQTVCTANIAQYFLLTPKLLPNMEFAEEVEVHTIVNGKMNNTRLWNNLRACEKRATLQD